MYIDSINQHNIPFVIVITIMVLSVHHDYIFLDYTRMVYCSGSTTPEENMSKHISRKICQECGYITSAYLCGIIIL